jgi:tripartite-type tricarboxylate transporter receptor subunit TctC
MDRRTLLSLAAALPATPAAAQGPAPAVAWPARPVRIISSSPPAGASDILTRTLADALQQQTGQPFVVENRPGAGGVVGSEHVAKSAADGYTWLTTNVGPQAIFPHLQRNLPYDTRRDFRHATIIGVLPLVLFVGREQPFATLADYLAAARARPGAVHFGSGGNGTLHHLTGELLKAAARVDITHVPYRGAQAATADVIGGRIESMWDSLPSAAPHLHNGTVRALALSTERRSPAFPDIPTLAEQGFPQVVTTNWFGIAGPSGIPDAIVEQMSEELRRALGTAQVRERLASIGVEPVGTPAAEAQAFARSEIERWGAVVPAIGVRLD